MTNQLLICTYYDKKSQSHDTPFFTLNKINAQRKFQMDIDHKDSIINKFKDDFELKLIGIFYIDTGEIDSQNETIATGNQFKKEEE